ncbi:MAG: kelch repeat-containing protein [Planctomycetota bacterium]
MLDRLIGLVLIAAPITGQAAAWKQLSPATTVPVSSNQMTMAHDVRRGLTVLHGAPGDQTWDWDGTTWRLAASTGPDDSDFRCMVYDSQRSTLVMAAHPRGALGTPLMVWEWSAGAWTQRMLALTPPGRLHFSMAYDSSRGVTVLFGGDRGSERLADTWEYDGNTWVQRSSGGPRPRNGAAMAYDAAHQVVVLFGGYLASGAVGETWVWDGLVWREFFGIAEPAPRFGHSMVYASDGRDRVVLFGGLDIGGRALNDTWEWDGSLWTEPATAGTRPAGGLAWTAAYNSTHAQVQVLGEPAPGPGGPGENWVYSSIPAVTPTFIPFGAGCNGSGGVPQLTAVSGSLPALGQTLQMDLAPLSQSVFVVPFGLVGGSRTTYATVPLPLDMGVLGAPGCSLHVAINVVLPMTKTGSSATWSLPIPFNLALAGRELYQQGFVLDAAANPFGAVTSNGVTVNVGT